MAPTQKCRPGRISRNPFFNFLREMRKRGMGLSMHQTEFCAWGANLWQGMSEEKRLPYTKLAKHAPIRGFVRTKRTKKPDKVLKPKEVIAEQPGTSREAQPEENLKPIKQQVENDRSLGLSTKHFEKMITRASKRKFENLLLNELQHKKTDGEEPLEPSDKLVKETVTPATNEDPKGAPLSEKKPNQNLQHEQIDPEGPKDVPVEGTDIQNRAIQMKEASTQTVKAYPMKVSLSEKDPGTDTQNRAVIQVQVASTQSTNEESMEVSLNEEDPGWNLQHEQIDSQRREDVPLEGGDAQNRDIIQIEEVSLQSTKRDHRKVAWNEKDPNQNFQHEQINVEGLEDVPVEDIHAQNRAIIQVDEMSTQSTKADPKEVSLSEEDLHHDQISPERREDVPIEGTVAQNTPLNEKDVNQNFQHEQINVERREDVTMEDVNAQNRVIHVEKAYSGEPKDVSHVEKHGITQSSQVQQMVTEKPTYSLVQPTDVQILPTQEEQATIQASQEEFNEVSPEKKQIDTEELENSPINQNDAQHQPIQEGKSATQIPQEKSTDVSAKKQHDSKENITTDKSNNPNLQAPLPQVMSNNRPDFQKITENLDERLKLPLKSPDVIVLQEPQQLGYDDKSESQGGGAERAVQILQKQVEMLRELLSNQETSTESHQEVQIDESSDDDLPQVDQKEMQNIMSRLEDSD